MKDVSLFFFTLIFFTRSSMQNDDMERLFDHLMSKYNKNVRPVSDNDDLVTVKLGLKLIQIVDVDEKNQMMQTHVYVIHEWNDPKFRWSPKNFSGIEFILVSSDAIWKPDLVLYNNADGDYHISSKSKARIFYDGTIIWTPPMIFKSYCGIDIQYYPFDTQNCTLKFGTWTYHGSLVNLQFLTDNQSSIIERGWDLEDYTPSIEWEILNLRAIRHEQIYACCLEVYIDLTFTCTMQRKPLFYVINLIVPCLNISILAIFVFLLPSDSNQKITLSVSILVILLVFYLLLIELIPPTSIVIPLLGKYLLFTLVLVNLSIGITIFTLNIHFRRDSPLDLPPWLRKFLLIDLPKLVWMERPKRFDLLRLSNQQFNSIRSETERNFDPKMVFLQQASEHISFIVDRLRKIQREKEIVEEWRFIALIFDRIFLIIFISIILIGTLGSLLKVPLFYNANPPVNPLCYLYNPPMDDAVWLGKCAVDFSAINQSFSNG